MINKIIPIAKDIGFCLTFLLITSCAGNLTKSPTIDAGLAKIEADRQRELFISEFFEANSRAQEVYWHLITDNSEFCTNRQAPYIGATFFHPAQFPEEFKEAATKSLNYTQGVLVWDIFIDSPGAISGLKRGDSIIAIGDIEVDDLRNFNEEIQKQFSNNVDVSFTIIRDDKTEVIQVSPNSACHYPLVLSASNELNAFANGNIVSISLGMMDFLRDENEVALVLGHELAHNLLFHVDKKKSNMVIGAIIGGLVGAATGINTIDIGAQIGAGAFSQEFETEADYVGVYYAARSGYDISNVANLWRRMAARNPSSIHLRGSTHPSSAIRFLLIEETVLEIRQKNSNGIKLIPNLESDD